MGCEWAANGLRVGDLLHQRIEEGRLAGGGAAGDDDVLARLHREPEEVGHAVGVEQALQLVIDARALLPGGCDGPNENTVHDRGKHLRAERGGMQRTVQRTER